MTYSRNTSSIINVGILGNPATPVELTADGQVKAAAGTLCGFRIQFSGVTIGDKVEIHDSTDATGTVIFTITAITVNEVHEFILPNGMIFNTGIYHNETKSGGQFLLHTVIFDSLIKGMIS